MAHLIVIVGMPNVGKSTLFNRLSKRKDALVDNRPGITRDRLYASITYGGISLTLVDTGGFSDLDQCPLLNQVRDQVIKALDEADRIIFMVDARNGIMPGDEEIADLLRRRQKKIFLVANKIDGHEHKHLAFEFYKLGFDEVFAISAAHGYGVRDFMQALIKDTPIIKEKKPVENQIRVSILGRPNVGKSSLINRILGHERLIVSDIPGTTRDAIDTPFQYRDQDFLLIDTAGIRRKSKVKEKIDKFSMIKAIQSLERCHVAIILLDAFDGISEQDARICGYALDRGRAVILVVNKWDLIMNDKKKQQLLNNAIERQLQFVSYAPKINLSALTGKRVMQLFDKIDLVYKQYSQQIRTPELNNALKKIIEKHPPPRTGRGRLKVLYATQTYNKPPTFTLFVNNPDLLYFSYERFLINQIRAHFSLLNTPVKLNFKKREFKKKTF